MIQEVTFTVVELGNWYNNLSLHATDNEAHVVSSLSSKSE